MSLFNHSFACAFLAVLWLFVQKVPSETVQYGIGVLRKLLTVFLIAPALLFFLWFGVDSGFNSDVAASQVFEAMQVGSRSKNLEVPTIKDDHGRIVMSEPRTEAELVSRVGGGIHMTYWLGAIVGALYVLLQWSILEGKAPRMTGNEYKTRKSRD
ncbi:hypothetical protein [Burkholderia sp. LMG 32019]|uniref:hypothetical protein n=1 Tax=Burkholderia sp. LMG 32019 TaxID=3158173 RepID=UPI003C2F93F5